MKKFIAAALATAMLTTSASAIDLYVDTEKIQTDVPPYVESGRTLVPVRAIFESLGATVHWDSDTQTVTGKREGTTVIMQLGSTTAYVNGETKILDVPAKAVNGRTLVPARFISEALGCIVTWNQDTQTAAVADNLKDQKIYVTKTGEKYHFSGTCNGGTYYEATLAEAMGRGLTPCDKCVLTVSQEEKELVVGDIVTFPAFYYFDENGNVSERASIGLGSKNVMFFYIGGEVYISELTLTTFLANILEEENINEGKTIITSDKSSKYTDYENLYCEESNGIITYTYKDTTFTYAEIANGKHGEVSLQDGCLAITRFDGWLFNANDLAEHFGVEKEIVYDGNKVIIK